MQKILKFLGIRRYSLKEMCVLAMLIAITAILAIYATFRIGNMIKIPFKFISVFITGALFGPIPAAFTALMGDVLNTFLAPVGPFLPQIAFVEFVSGFIYGCFFYNCHKMSKSYILRLCICVFLQALLDITLTSYFLTGVGYFPSFFVAVGSRFPATVLKAALQSIVILLSCNYLPTFSKLIRR